MWRRVTHQTRAGAIRWVDRDGRRVALRADIVDLLHLHLHAWRRTTVARREADRRHERHLRTLARRALLGLRDATRRNVQLRALAVQLWLEVGRTYTQVPFRAWYLYMVDKQLLRRAREKLTRAFRRRCDRKGSAPSWRRGASSRGTRWSRCARAAARGGAEGAGGRDGGARDLDEGLRHRAARGRAGVERRGAEAGRLARGEGGDTAGADRGAPRARRRAARGLEAARRPPAYELRYPRVQGAGRRHRRAARAAAHRERGGQRASAPAAAPSSPPTRPPPAAARGTCRRARAARRRTPSCAGCCRCSGFMATGEAADDAPAEVRALLEAVEHDAGAAEARAEARVVTDDLEVPRPLRMPLQPTDEEAAAALDAPPPPRRRRRPARARRRRSRRRRRPPTSSARRRRGGAAANRRAALVCRALGAHGEDRERRAGRRDGRRQADHRPRARARAQQAGQRRRAPFNVYSAEDAAEPPEPGAPQGVCGDRGVMNLPMNLPSCQSHCPAFGKCLLASRRARGPPHPPAALHLSTATSFRRALACRAKA